MNSGNQPNLAGSQAHVPGLTLDDVYFTLFRHKWLIFSFICLGLVGAAAVRAIKPPLYVSTAELMVKYVVDSRAVNPQDPSEQIRNTDPFGQNIINTEVAIVKSLDVATNVAEIVGPARVLAKKGGGNDPLAAAGVISSGIEVEVPLHTSILKISFKHPDKAVVQQVLGTVIEVYKEKHTDVHLKGAADDYFARLRDESSSNLARLEDQLRQLKAQANVIYVEDTKRSFQTQILKYREQLLNAQAELAERKAALGPAAAEALLAETTNAAGSAVPAETANDYSAITSQLEALKRKERDYTLLDGFQDAHPLVGNVRERIQTLKLKKSELEKQYPVLAQLISAPVHSGTNSIGADLAADRAEIKRLSVTVSTIGTLLTNLEAQVDRLMDAEPKIAELQRRRDLEETNYQRYATSLQRASAGEAGKGINISQVENPTPPGRDTMQVLKLMAAVLGGCVGLGLALAFLIDFVFDRTIRRSTDIERHLRLPVFLSIPDTSWTGRLRWPRLLGWGRAQSIGKTAATGNGSGPHETALALRDSMSPLQPHTEGLRERLITYFEIHNLNLKKPKLVAVTGCGHGSGVTTLASGLASELSKTGDGNVLLVDMNAGEGAAHSFYKGKAGCGLADVLEPDGRVNAQVHEKLYLASLDDQSKDKLAKVQPTRFTHLVPKLKASDYDYIIFDMPPVSPTSATPRLASHMDIVLLVLESEKTGQKAAARATALMRESRANVAAVLNKAPSHVPARLLQEL